MWFFVQCRHIIAPAYEKSFGIVYIGAIFEFLVSHCYIWSKKKKKNSKFNFCWENFDVDEVLDMTK